MKIRTFSLLALIVMGIGLFQHAHAGEASVSGTVVSGSTRRPVPGVTVSLVHPERGRSASATTDSNGHFAFFGIPGMPTPYYIEIYWGKDLLYRNTHTIQGGNVVLPEIRI